MNATEIGKNWALPNYVNELFRADVSQTPLLSMIGGLTGGRQTTSSEFPTAVLFDYPQSNDREASKAEEEQEGNVVQRYGEMIDLSYMRVSDEEDENSVEDEIAFQMHHRLVNIARNVEHSFINGRYYKDEYGVAGNRTRGLIELTENGTTIDAHGGMLTKRMLDCLYKKMEEAGAYFDNMVMFLPAFQKQVLTDIYAKEFNATWGAREHIGGVACTQIETGKFKMGVVCDRFIPKDTILLVDVAHLTPVFQTIPEKGVIYEEKTSSDTIEIDTRIGLAHAPAFLHGSITNLSFT